MAEKGARSYLCSLVAGARCAVEERPLIGPGGLSSNLAPAFRTAQASAEMRQTGASGGERFGDWSAFDAGAEGQVGLGRERASIDPVHAARTVAAFVLEG